MGWQDNSFGSGRPSHFSNPRPSNMSVQPNQQQTAPPPQQPAQRPSKVPTPYPHHAGQTPPPQQPAQWPIHDSHHSHHSHHSNHNRGPGGNQTPVAGNQLPNSPSPGHSSHGSVHPTSAPSRVPNGALDVDECSCRLIARQNWTIGIRA